jgi:predicted O-methyltransferase YrrM
MAADRWAEVDSYVTELLAPHDAVLDRVLVASEAAGIPAIQVSPPQGKLLGILARSIGAKTILEFGEPGHST